MLVKEETFLKNCDKVMAFSFYAFIYFLPISIALIETFGSLSLVTFFVKRIGLFFFRLREKREQSQRVGFGGSVRLFLESGKPVSSFLSWPIGLFILANAVTIFISQDVKLSLEGFFFKVLQGTFLYFTFIECINSKKRLKIFMTLFIVSCLLICVNGVWQSLLGKGFIRGHVYEGQIASSLRQANDLGAYLICIIPLLFYFLYSSQHRTREVQRKDISSIWDGLFDHPWRGILLGIVFVLAMFCLCLTASRGAWVGLIGGIILLVCFDKRTFFMAVFVMILFLVLAYSYMLVVRLDIQNLSSFITANNRFLYWEGPPHIIKDYPILGTGVNTYSVVEKRYAFKWGGYPHNCYLQMVAETGFVGLLSFLSIIVVFLLGTIKRYRRLADPFFKTVVLGAVCGTTAFLIHSFFDTNFYSVQLGNLMWVMLGLTVAPLLINQSLEKIKT